MDVREDFRKKGVEKQLVESARKRGISSDRYAVTIECKPESSSSFWKKIGFEFYNENEASFVFEKLFDLPIKESPINVKIMFYQEQVKWIPQTALVKSISPLAMLDPKGTIHLQYRVAAYVNSKKYNRDTMIKI
ncbi:MAG: hypothetical protein COA36_03630 [Desulfotalea sp.]|nr:MAG: hypothetical protein COA36_03630 [Desulfotalea sp.]